MSDLKCRLLEKLDADVASLLSRPTMWGMTMESLESMLLLIYDYRDLTREDGKREEHHMERPFWEAYRRVLTKRWKTAATPASVHLRHAFSKRKTHVTEMMAIEEMVKFLRAVDRAVKRAEKP